MKILTLVILICLSILSRGNATDEAPYLSREPAGKTAAEIFGECLVSTNPVALFMREGAASRTSFPEMRRAVEMLGASQNERAKDVLYELFVSLPPVEAGTDVGQTFEVLVLTQLLGKLDVPQKKVLLERVFKQEIDALKTTFRNQGATLYYPESLLMLAITNMEKEQLIGEMQQQFEAAASDPILGGAARIAFRKALVRYELINERKLSVGGVISSLVQELKPKPIRSVPYAVYNDSDAYRKLLTEDANYRRESQEYVLWRESPQGIRNMALEQLLSEYGEISIAHLLDSVDKQVYDRTKSEYLVWLSSEILKNATRKKALSDEKQRFYRQKIYEHVLSMDNSVYGGYFQRICSNLLFENPKLLR